MLRSDRSLFSGSPVGSNEMKHISSSVICPQQEAENKKEKNKEEENKKEENKKEENNAEKQIQIIPHNTCSTSTDRGNNESSVGVLNGLRLLSAVVVVFHHIGALDNSLWDQEALQKNQRRVRNRIKDYLPKKERQNDRRFLFERPIILDLMPKMPGRVALATFIIIAGFVAAHGVHTRIKSMRNSTNPTSSTKNMSALEITAVALMKRYSNSLLHRYLRLALPVLPAVVLYQIFFQLAWIPGPYNTVFANSTHREYYILSAWAEGPIRGIFSSQLNGAFWIMPILFSAPFLSLSIQVPAFSLTPCGRAVWYCCILLYFGGSFNTKTTDNNIMVVLGVVLADIYHCEWKKWSRLKFLAFYCACLFAFLIPWFPEPIYSAHITETIGGAGTFALIVFCPLQRLKSIFDNRCCKYFQGSAFYIYIWHLLIYGVCLINVEPHVSKPVLYSVGCSAAILLPVFLWWVMDGYVKKCATFLTKKMFVQMMVV